jgi:hypothetical protein
MPREQEGFTIEGAEAVRETSKALLVEADFFDEGQAWIPRSQIHADSEVFELHGKGKLVVTAWWAKKQEWV